MMILDSGLLFWATLYIVRLWMQTHMHGRAEFNNNITECAPFVSQFAQTSLSCQIGNAAYVTHLTRIASRG